MNELDWKQPALIGGVLAGFLSVIPGINLVNCCFCAWLLVGGAVAAKMVINRTPRPVKSGEGAQIGAIAGLIAAGVYLAIGIPLAIFGVLDRVYQAFLERLAESNGSSDLQELVRKAKELSESQTPAQRLVSALPVLIAAGVLFTGFSTLGGLLGVALFEKRRESPPPPYSPGYPPQYPQNYPQQPPPWPNYPPQNPPQSGGSGGDQGEWPQG
ncbi:MAG: hypothetical protein J2P52_07020 [Blastocatellia bacterium]|nr:hypothetical protein [Blastocatellia bacterium]